MFWQAYRPDSGSSALVPLPWKWNARPEPGRSSETGRRTVPESVPQITFQNIRTEMNSGSMCGIGGSGLACAVSIGLA